MVQTGNKLACVAGHSFDQARQGYTTLRSGKPSRHIADTAEMVAARDKFLSSGHYEPLAEEVSRLTVEHANHDGLIIDLAGGTGYYLAQVLNDLEHCSGICFDLSTYALRRAARAHPNAVALGVDLRERLPLKSQCAAIALSIFGPRNVPELKRVLQHGGIFVAVTPNGQHLQELIEPLGMLHIPEAKEQRLRESLTLFERVDQAEVTYTLQLNHEDIEALAGMGPSAHHIEATELAERVRTLPSTVDVTVSVTIGVFRVPPS